MKKLMSVFAVHLCGLFMALGLTGCPEMRASQSVDGMGSVTVDSYNFYGVVPPGDPGFVPILGLKRDRTYQVYCRTNAPVVLCLFQRRTIGEVSSDSLIWMTTYPEIHPYINLTNEPGAAANPNKAMVNAENEDNPPLVLPPFVAIDDEGVVPNTDPVERNEYYLKIEPATIVYGSNQVDSYAYFENWDFSVRVFTVPSPMDAVPLALDAPISSGLYEGQTHLYKVTIPNRNRRYELKLFTNDLHNVQPAPQPADQQIVNAQFYYYDNLTQVPGSLFTSNQRLSVFEPPITGDYFIQVTWNAPTEWTDYTIELSPLPVDPAETSDGDPFVLNIGSAQNGIIYPNDSDDFSFNATDATYTILVTADFDPVISFDNHQYSNTGSSLSVSVDVQNPFGGVIDFTVSGKDPQFSTGNYTVTVVEKN